jgi:outer membrane receptor for ferrienterochelin and colicins
MNYDIENSLSLIKHMHSSTFTAGSLALFLAAAPVLAQTTPPKTLAEVLVTPAPSRARPGALRDELIKTESISAQEISQSGATNLTELMANRPGIDVQVECSVCNSRNITLNNLPGRFTTVMVDGVPIFSSVSNAYGLDMIGLNGLERVEVSRGAGTSLVAPESLAGTVNLVTKRPASDGVELDLGLGSYGLQRQSLFATKLLAGGALSLSAILQKQDSVDAVGSGISQYTGHDRAQLGAGLFLDDVGGFKLKARLDHLEGKRMGGPLGTDHDAVRADRAGNPFDFSQGPNASPDKNSWIDPSTGLLTAAYADGRFGVAQIVHTRRDQLVATGEKKVGPGKLRLALGYAEHQQDSWYGGDADYFGKQQQVYLESSYSQAVNATLLTGGVSYRYEDLHSRSYSLNNPLALALDADAYVYRTPGVFVQAYRSFFEERLEAYASLRHDQNNVYGDITTPRMNLLWHHSDEVSSRLSMGTGYRLPTSFFELEHAVLQASGVDRSQARAETSDNLSYAWSYAGDRVTVTASVNHTRINNLALFVADPNNATGLLLQPAASAYSVNNADFVGTWQVSARDALTLGLEHYQYDFNAADFQGSLFARPEHRLMLALDHTDGPWNLNLKATYTGPQNLAKFFDYANKQRFDLNGSPKPDWSPAFWVLDLHANYQVNKSVSAYLGINNALDYKQASSDSFLWVDPAGALDVTHIWGPNLGRSVSAGVKITF